MHLNLTYPKIDIWTRGTVLLYEFGCGETTSCHVTRLDDGEYAKQGRLLDYVKKGHGFKDIFNFQAGPTRRVTVIAPLTGLEEMSPTGGLTPVLFNCVVTLIVLKCKRPISPLHYRNHLIVPVEVMGSYANSKKSVLAYV